MTRVVALLLVCLYVTSAFPQHDISDEQWNSIESPVFEEEVEPVQGFAALDDGAAEGEDCPTELEEPAEVELDVTAPIFIPTEAPTTEAPECAAETDAPKPEVDSSCEMEWGDWSKCLNSEGVQITCGETGFHKRIRECECEPFTMGLNDEGLPKTCADFQLEQTEPCKKPCTQTTTTEEPTPAPTQAAPKSEPACKEKAVDIVFVLDGSSSVGPRNFTVAQNFINGIVDKFSVSAGGVKIGLLQYSTSPRIEFNLNDHTTKAAVKQAVDNVEWILGDTHTAYALRETYNSIIAPLKGDKSRSRFVIVITDGDPQDFKKVPAAVTQLGNAGVKIFAVGVGDATVPELKKLGFSGKKSAEKDYYYADDYESAKVFTDTLVKLICKNV